MKQKLKEKYILDSYKRRLLDKLHSLHHGSKSVQDYTIKFDDLTLRCKVQEDSYQAISRYRSGKRSDIQRASHAAQDNLIFSSERKIVPKAWEQPSPNTHR